MLFNQSPFPSYLESENQAQLEINREASQTPIILPLEAIKDSNELNESPNPNFMDCLTENQYEDYSKEIKKAASSLPTEDAWDLLKKSIKKPKKMKVTRSSLKCKICQSGFRSNTIVLHFQCNHLCHEDCTFFYKRISSKCPVCATKDQNKDEKRKL